MKGFEMDVSKISAKVARMAPVREKGKILSEIEPVGIDDIHRLQKKAEEEGKTLAEVFKDEADPDTFKTVSIEELAAVAKKAAEEGVSPGSILREYDKTGELDIEEEEEEIEDLLPPPPAEPIHPEPSAPPTEPAVEEPAPPVEPVAEEETPVDPAVEETPVEEPTEEPAPPVDPDVETKLTVEEYKAALAAKTRVELKEFAKANNLEFINRIPTVKLIDQIAESVGYEFFVSYFEG